MKIQSHMKMFFLVLALFYKVDVFAVSGAGGFDGQVQIAIKNKNACFYMKNGKNIHSILISPIVLNNEDNIKYKTWHSGQLDGKKGGSLESCIAVAELQGNIPYEVAIQDVSRKSVHAAHVEKFCISSEQQNVYISEVSKVQERDSDRWGCTKEPLGRQEKAGWWQKLRVLLGIK